MLLVEPGAGHDPFRFEPDENFHTFRVRVLADRFKPAGEPFRVDLPGPDLGPAVLLDVPAGVHPPGVDLQALFQIAIDVQDLVGLVGPDHLLVGARAGGDKLGRRELPARLGHAVGHHPAAPGVLCIDPVSVPEQQGDERRADLFARQQLEMGQLLPGADTEPRCALALEFGRPLAGPADGENHPPRSPLEIEIRQVGVRRPPAGSTDPLLGAGGERSLQRPVIRTVGRRTDRVAEQELGIRPALPRRVERLDVLQDRGLRLAGVLEGQEPLGGREVVVLDRLAADDQPGSRIGPRSQMAGPLLVEFLNLAVLPPGGEKLGRWLAVVDKRERRAGLVRAAGARQTRGDPLPTCRQRVVASGRLAESCHCR